MNPLSMSDEELQAVVRNKFLKVQATNGSKQKVVSVNEVNEFLEKGWQYVDKVGSKVVIKSPGDIA